MTRLGFGATIAGYVLGRGRPAGAIPSIPRIKLVSPRPPELPPLPEPASFEPFRDYRPSMSGDPGRFL